MRFFIDGRMDIRPLASQDIPNISLPYNEIGVAKVVGDIENNNLTTVTWRDTDWGVGKDFYITRLHIRIDWNIDTMRPFRHRDSGVWIYIKTDEGRTVLDKSYDSQNIKPVWITNWVFSDWTFAETIFLPIPKKIPNTDTIDGWFYNSSGEDTMATTYLELIGMIVDP